MIAHSGQLLYCTVPYSLLQSNPTIRRHHLARLQHPLNWIKELRPLPRSFFFGGGGKRKKKRVQECTIQSSEDPE